MCENRCCNFRRQKRDKEASQNDSKNYKYLTKETQRMWNVGAKAIQVIRGTTGTISKSRTQYLNNIPGRREIKERLQNQPF